MGKGFLCDKVLGDLAAAKDHTGVYETELKQVERQLKAVEREQHQLLQWALNDFPAEQVEAENKRLNKAKETLKSQKTELKRPACA